MKTTLSLVRQLKTQLERFEEGVEIDNSYSISTATVIYVHTPEKIIYGDYSALTTLGYNPYDMGKTARKIITENTHPEDEKIRENLFDFFKNDSNDSWSGTYRIKAKDGNYHTFVVYATCFRRDADNAPEQILNLEYDITALTSKNDRYTEAIGRALWTSVTKREKQIIKHIQAGSRNQDIAAELEISLNTVETHRKNLLRKLGMKNTTSLLHYVAKYQLE